MADYRLSAQIIGRSSGRSAVAAAAYRAGEVLFDQRTGVEHDFTRKGGVLHTEILAPANAPAWMEERACLWNAVEAVETRRNSQMAREIQLSLPHELDFEANRQLVREYVLEQFVAKGMVADVAIHAPDRAGDARNIHAHVLLTTRTLTAEGFGKKERAWNEREQLEAWREQWALHQNRALSRAGEDGRVDHRSFERQGIDREPTVHMGPHATERQRYGLQSDLGDLNALIRARNDGVVDARRAFEARKFEAWADRRRGQVQAEHVGQRQTFEARALAAASSLQDRLRDQFGALKVRIERERQETASRLEARGLRKVVRDLFGRTSRDRRELAGLLATRADIARIEVRHQETLKATLAARRSALDAEQTRDSQRLEGGIQRARQRREATDWAAQAEAFRSARDPKARAQAEQQAARAAEARVKEAVRQHRKEGGPQRAKAARADRAAQLEALYRKLEASRGITAKTPETEVARKFAAARKHEQTKTDREPDR